MSTTRTGQVERSTLETKIKVSVNLDGTGKGTFNTKIPFLEHMLEQISRHSLVDIDVLCDGDVHIDDHHSTEDIGIALGQAFNQAIGDKKGIYRYGHAYVPLDEALSRVVIDFSGRPMLCFEADFPSEKIGRFDTELVREFFQGFTNHAGVTLHMDNLRGINSHHIAETLFKAFGRAVRAAISPDPQMSNVIPSTKGML